MDESEAAANRQTTGSLKEQGAVTERTRERAREGGEMTESVGDNNRRKLLNYAP